MMTHSMMAGKDPQTYQIIGTAMEVFNQYGLSLQKAGLNDPQIAQTRSAQIKRKSKSV